MISEQDILDEEIRERNNEHYESKFDSWLSDNRDELIKEFVEEFYSDEFDTHCHEMYAKEN